MKAQRHALVRALREKREKEKELAEGVQAGGSSGADKEFGEATAVGGGVKMEEEASGGLGDEIDIKEELLE